MAAGGGRPEADPMRARRSQRFLMMLPSPCTQLAAQFGSGMRAWGVCRGRHIARLPLWVLWQCSIFRHASTAVPAHCSHHCFDQGLYGYRTERVQYSISQHRPQLLAPSMQLRPQTCRPGLHQPVAPPCSCHPSQRRRNARANHIHTRRRQAPLKPFSPPQRGQSIHAKCGTCPDAGCGRG